MLGSILTSARAWLLGGALVLGATAIDAGAGTTCGRASGSFVSQLDACNVADPSCGSGAATEFDIIVANLTTFETYQTGTFFRCANTSDLIWFFGAGGLHVFETANGGTWGAVGGGLCSFYSYDAYAL